MPERISGQEPLPVTVIGGYLGSGKTTLVNHLLRKADGLRLAILVNEFGELPIDADLIEAKDDTMISLSGGCVCCSYGNDLVMAMMDLAKMEPRPDHVVLEASGVALPGAVAASITLLPDYALDGVVVLADAETVHDRARDTYTGDTILRQLADADLVLLNKTDLVDAAQKDVVRNWLTQQAPGAAVLETCNSAIDPGAVLQSFLTRLHPPGDKPFHHIGPLKTRRLDFDGPVDADALASQLAGAAPDIVRAKGFVEGLDGALKTIQVVGRRWSVEPAPAGVSTGLVVIGPDPEAHEVPSQRS